MGKDLYDAEFEKKHKHKSRQKHPPCSWHRRAESEKDLGEEDGKILCNTAD